MPLVDSRRKAMAETVTMMPTEARSLNFTDSYGTGTMRADLSYR